MKNHQVSSGFLNIWFYQFGLKALENGKLRISHLNALMRLLKRKFKKELSIRLNASLITPITKKPREVRMGKGKGQRLCWESNIKKGMIIFEVGGNVKSNEELKRVLFLIQQKMPLSTSIVKLTY